MASNAREYDFVVFGATGFTGQFVVQELYDAVTKGGQGFKIAVAGRSEGKVRDVLQTVSQRTGIAEVLQIPVLIADAARPESMSAMCKQTRCVLNCVGPYRFFGEACVSACVDNGTDYLDITGEPEFMERMVHKYHSAACDTGSIVVSSCGFDSIPADLGCEFCVEQFPQRELVNSVESYLTVHYDNSANINYATWESAVHGFASQGELRKVRSEARAVQIQQGKGARLPVVGPSLRSKHSLHYNNVVQKWILPFHGSDASVVRRTQRHLFEEFELPPVQFGAYLGLHYWRNGFLAVVLGAVFAFLAQYKWGRSLLLNHPAFFSCGLVRKNFTPREEDIKSTSLEMRFVGLGYSDAEKAKAGARPDLRIVTRCTGPEPGYVLTPIVLVAAALTIRQERARLCVPAGVWTPAVALRNTQFRERVRARGVQFEVMEKSGIA